MRLKTVVNQAVKEFRQGSTEALQKLVEEEPGSLRYLLGMTYQDDPELRMVAARAIAMGSKSHPGLVQDMVRRLVWAMNDESGTNALTAPSVLRVLAQENPRLLLPVVPDLTRLSSDPGLKDLLTETLRIITEKCPGEVGNRLTRSLRKRIEDGGTKY